MVKHRQDMARVVRAPFRAREQPTLLHINTREELINALHEAIQIEHGLMLQYLYAALSCKRFPYEGLDDRQTEVVRDWEGRLLKIARDEMAHLATACNLLNAIGGTPNFARPHFPQPRGRWFPFNFQLEKLNTASLRRFVRAESPPPLMEAQLRGIAPDPIDYDYVGELYRSISSGFETLETQGIDLFIGAPEVQDSSDWSGNLRIFPIRDVASAQAAIEFIVRQGEGTPAGQTGTHFAEFNALLAALQAEQQRDARFDPARNIVANPLTRPQRDAGKGAFVIAQASLAHPVAELCNHVYSTLLMLLTQFFDPVGETRQQRDIVQAAARRAMSGIVRPLAEVLTTLPATADASGPHAAAPFEIYGDLRLPAYPRARWTLLIERTTLEAAECLKLATLDERLTRLTFIGRNLELLQSTITAASTEGASQ